MELTDVFKLKKQDWLKVGQYAADLVKRDMEVGIFQNERFKFPYKSQQYKKYKAKFQEISC